MEKQEKLRKVWLFLLGAASVLFMVLGLAKIIADQAYFEGSIKLVIAITFLVATLLIYLRKINIDFTTVKGIVFVNMGFVFIIVGSAGIDNVGIAGFGYVLFLAGLFNKERKNFKV